MATRNFRFYSQNLTSRDSRLSVSSKISTHSSGSDDNQETGVCDELGNHINAKQLRMLKFENPGRFMEDFDPERSTREMRKVNRRIYRETLRKNQVYDEIGRILTDSRDVCDCLDSHCKGCHFPCPKCASEKCGTECRCNRRCKATVRAVMKTSRSDKQRRVRALRNMFSTH